MEVSDSNQFASPQYTSNLIIIYERGLTLRWFPVMQIESSASCTKRRKSFKKRTVRTKGGSNKNRTKSAWRRWWYKITTAVTSSTLTTNRWRTPQWSYKTDTGRIANTNGSRKVRRLPFASRTITATTRSRGEGRVGRVLPPQVSSKFTGGIGLLVFGVRSLINPGVRFSIGLLFLLSGRLHLYSHYY